jgi:hypothetical protein
MPILARPFISAAEGIGARGRGLTFSKNRVKIWANFLEVSRVKKGKEIQANWEVVAAADINDTIDVKSGIGEIKSGIVDVKSGVVETFPDWDAFVKGLGQPEVGAAEKTGVEAAYEKIGRDDKRLIGKNGKFSWLKFVAAEMRGLRAKVSGITTGALAVAGMGAAAVGASALGLIPPEYASEATAAGMVAVGLGGFFAAPAAQIVGAGQMETLRDVQSWERTEAMEKHFKRQHPRVQRNLEAVLKQNSPRPITGSADLTK